MQQTTNAGGGNSVNVINSSVNVQSGYAGSVPEGEATGEVIPLTLEKALALGLKQNLGAIGESAAVKQAQGERKAARSVFLPNLNTAITEELAQLNLRTTGVESNMFPLTVKINFYDARFKLNETAFDLVSSNNLRSASESVKASILGAKNSRDLIVLAVGGGYLQVIAAKARVAAAAAQVESSTAIYQQAADRFESGLNARVDATRAKVQLQTEQQRLRSLQADLDTQKLRLSRVIGLPIGQKFDVSENYDYAAMNEFNLDSALKRAYENRADLQSAQAGLRAAESSLKAAHAERLPNIKVNADWGAAGLRPTSDTSAVYSVAGTLNVPIYEGGRISGEIQQAKAAVEQRKAEYEDLRGQVDQDVRQAFIDMNSAADQVDVAKSNVDLSHESLTQSRDRFTSGVADTVELVQAEQAVVQADNDYINAVFEHNLAKVSLARAMGNAEQTLPQILRKTP